jgi:hypothetical protein
MNMCFVAGLHSPADTHRARTLEGNRDCNRSGGRRVRADSRAMPTLDGCATDAHCMGSSERALLRQHVLPAIGAQRTRTASVCMNVLCCCAPRNFSPASHGRGASRAVNSRLLWLDCSGHNYVGHARSKKGGSRGARGALDQGEVNV